MQYRKAGKASLYYRLAFGARSRHSCNASEILSNTTFQLHTASISIHNRQNVDFVFFLPTKVSPKHYIWESFCISLLPFSVLKILESPITLELVMASIQPLTNTGIHRLTSGSRWSSAETFTEQPLKKRINSLQSMRLLASLAVFQYHLWTNYLGRPFLHPGTDFFIVLVGMVAALSDAGKIARGEWKNYILGRYLRLYVTFIPVFLLYVLAGRDEITPTFLIKSFFFIPLPEGMPLVGPTWMLAMFLVFYWLFSLAFISRREASLIPIFTLWGIGCLLTKGLDLDTPVFDEGFQLLFSIRNLEFIAGYAGGWLVRNGHISGELGRKLLGIGLFILLAGMLLLNSGKYDNSIRVMLYGTAMTLIASGLASQERDAINNVSIQVFTHPWIVWLGGASYVLYLTHNMFLRIWDTVLPLTPWQVPLVTFIALMVAGLGYQFWEKPILAFLRRKWLAKEYQDKLEKSGRF
jgi:peptidoglycan/LPS O-acetylase OafA/YrhL